MQTRKKYNLIFNPASIIFYIFSFLFVRHSFLHREREKYPDFFKERNYLTITEEEMNKRLLKASQNL